MTSAYLLDWLNLFFRWFHVIAGIAWIGASFYFIWLDLSLEEPPEWKKKKGISGDLWAVHGGGFYEVAKYKLEPEAMPKNLHWFKWEAYTTWLTGMAMLSIVYYAGAQAYLIDANKVAFSTPAAILTSLAVLFGGYLVYEILLKSPLARNAKAFALVLFAFLVLMSWGVYQLFNDRAAYIHIGALLGTIMAANVLRGIMPAQRALVDTVAQGKKPDAQVAALAANAKLRSTHNNYFTLPLIFIMLSNHYPMTYGHAYGWLVLVAIGVITAFTRHYFNLKHQGNKRPMILVLAAVATVALMWMIRPAEKPEPELVAGNTKVQVTDAQALSIVQSRCNTCHAAKPTQQGFAAPPAGIVLSDTDALKQHQARITTALKTNYMPLGNITEMTDEERQQLLDYVAAIP